MLKLNRCQKCKGKPIMNAIPKTGVPSGDQGYQTTIVCLDCGYKQTTWALHRSWAISTAVNTWNEPEKDGD